MKTSIYLYIYCPKLMIPIALVDGGGPMQVVLVATTWRAAWPPPKVPRKGRATGQKSGLDRSWKYFFNVLRPVFIEEYQEM